MRLSDRTDSTTDWIDTVLEAIQEILIAWAGGAMFMASIAVYGAPFWLVLWLIWR